MNQLLRNITSLEVAEMVGRDHNEVLKDLRRISTQLGEGILPQSYFIESSYTNSQNKELPSFLLTKKGCELYGTRMTGGKGTQFAVKYIDRFNEMEETIQQKQLLQDPITLALKAALETREQIQTIQQDVNLLKGTMRIDGRQEYALKEQGKSKVLQELGGYGSLAYEKLSRKVFAQLWRDFKKHFILPRSTELPRERFDEGVKFIAMWRPDTTLAIDIEAANKQAQFKLVE
ncbi:ORF6C domain-containing protein [Solibacillus sp. MA9]|uniref:ORF6C domain-containing protein n=1 Tax=Solibacillus palustris TaxID=2908203 RepID=A0ABS9UBM6_9BACL|nr:Rha family transcriptional regulator [Solibacillus sp. MA9]MCH7321746.1 ORF6C domain-containing protein [Solibacillus sp. MA9]